MDELQCSNPLWHRQRWPGMNASLITHYPTAEDVQRILATPNFAYWGGGPASDHFFGALESVHNDANVDRLFAQWQELCLCSPFDTPISLQAQPE